MTSLAKKLAPWLGLVSLLFTFAVYTASCVVLKEVYLMNQIEQDRRILELEHCVKELQVQRAR